MNNNEKNININKKLIMCKKNNMISDNTEEINKYNITDNIDLYIGDSKALPCKQTFKMVYFDPPFNSDRNYKLSNTNELGFSDKWNDTEYYDFIKINIDKLYDMLDEDGTLFFHISSTCMFIPEKILRDKFKLVEPIFWKKCRSKNNVKTKLGSVIDIIWKCNKTKKYKFNLVTQDKDETYLKNSFKNKDYRGNYALGHLVTENTKQGYLYKVEINGLIFNPKSGWRIKEICLNELIKEDKIHIPKKKGGKLYKKIYLHENPGKPCTDLWDDIHSISQGSEVRKYPTAKPVKLLERLIQISTDEGDLIYDPMCGSGTTAEAAKNLNRKCIINDINKEVISIVQSRFQ